MPKNELRLDLSQGIVVLYNNEKIITLLLSKQEID